MVDTAQIASYLGVEDDSTFQVDVDAALSSLEERLGYPLCGDGTFQTRSFPYRPYEIWHRVDPFYELDTAVIKGYRAQEDTLDDYQVSQNGQFNGEWNNRIRTCGCSASCLCHDRCTTIEVTAKWGFAPLVDGLCSLPPDLFKFLSQITKDSGDNGLQSESRGTRSYSRFPKEDVWKRYALTLHRYSNRRLFA